MAAFSIGDDPRGRSVAMDAPKRRRRSAEETWQVFLEAAVKDQPTVEVLRRHGLHATDFTRIREAVRRGALTEASRTQGPPKEDPERHRLREELSEMSWRSPQIARRTPQSSSRRPRSLLGRSQELAE
jgi:hypothetical protein